MTNLPIIISSLSLLISFSVAFQNYWKSRVKIGIIQKYHSQSGILKSYDGSQNFTVTKKSDPCIPKIESLALAEIIITNESSVPISILEFEIDGAQEFTSYSYTEDFYTITTSDNSKTYFGTPSVPMKFLKPEFTLAPYTSDRGYLFFWLNNQDSVKRNEKLNLRILTSRGIVNKSISFKNVYESIKSDELIID